jgi:hypothetical protein
MKYIIQENTSKYGWEDVETVCESESKELINIYRKANPGVSFKLVPVKQPVEV